MTKSNPLGAGTANITACTDEDRADYIRARAKRLGWSVSKFADETILEHWFTSGCPAVAEADRALPKLVYKAGAKAKR